MRLDRDLADAELESYLLVQQAADDECHDLLFAATERCVTVAQRLDLRLATECGSAAFEGVADSGEQDLVVEGLGQKPDRDTLHRLDRHRDIGVPGEEDDGHVGPIPGDLPLHIEPSEVGKIDVEDKTAWRGYPRTREKLLCGFECLGIPTGESDHRFKRLAHRDVVI